MQPKLLTEAPPTLPNRIFRILFSQQRPVSPGEIGLAYGAFLRFSVRGDADFRVAGNVVTNLRCCKHAGAGEGSNDMLVKKMTAIGMVGALLLATSGTSLAEDSAETTARNKADWEWQREQGRQHQYELRKQDEESRRNSKQDSDSSCGLGCKLFLGAAALVIGCAAGVICNDNQKSTEPGVRPPAGAAR
jgi:hypothetical protein